MSEWGTLTEWHPPWLYSDRWEASRRIDAGRIRVSAGKATAPPPDKYQWIVDLHPWPTEDDLWREETPEPQRIARGYCATLEAAKRCAETIANDAERMIELMGSTNTTAKD